MTGSALGSGAGGNALRDPNSILSKRRASNGSHATLPFRRRCRHRFASCCALSNRLRLAKRVEVQPVRRAAPFTRCRTVSTVVRERHPRINVISQTEDGGRAPWSYTQLMDITLTAVLLPAVEGGFTALNPETGTTSQGETIDEALANLREATGLFLEEFPLASSGEPLVTTFRVAVNA